MSKDIKELIEHYSNIGYDYKRMRTELIEKGFKKYDIDKTIEERFGKKALNKAVSKETSRVFYIFLMSIIQPKKLFLRLKEDDALTENKYLFFSYITLAIEIIIVGIILNNLELDIDIKSIILTFNPIFLILTFGYLVNLSLLTFGSYDPPWFRHDKNQDKRENKAIIYSSGLIFILGIIPFINILTGVYSLYLQALSESIFLDQKFNETIRKKMIETILKILFNIILLIIIYFVLRFIFKM
jgi:hypothetical protein